MSVQKVQTDVLQHVRGQADGTKYVFIFIHVIYALLSLESALYALFCMIKCL